MKESFLHYVWATRQFCSTDLKTTTGEHLVIHKQGSSHQDGGPDFKNGLIQIEEELWAGNIEIHIKSSDWFAHNHHLDTTYDSTILHVVFNHDKEVRRTNDTVIPCLELKDKISEKLLNQYHSLTNNSHKIPCEMLVANVSASIKTLMLESMAIKRIQEKASPIYAKLDVSKNDWEEVLYQEICISFGMRLNKVPFGLLAKSVPFKLIQQYRNDRTKIEALYFGCAGYLNANNKGHYFKKLKTEFAFLQRKHELTSLDPSLWNFLRLRPPNFPTIRISQLSQLMCTSQTHLRKLISNLTYKHLYELFRVDASEFWSNHYTFSKKSTRRKKIIGQSTIHTILINAVIPVLYCYGLEHNDFELQEKCLSLLEQLPPEKNTVTNYFRSLNFPIENSLQSQGVLQLHNKNCIFKACLDCSIGHNILKENTL